MENGTVLFVEDNDDLREMFVDFWITSRYWASAGRLWTPFEAHKLGTLAVPLVAPQLGVGLAAIAGGHGHRQVFFSIRTSSAGSLRASLGRF